MLSTTTFSASFDCTKASTAHEKLICNTPELNDADTQLGKIYGLVLKKIIISDLVRIDQRLWLNGYRNCKFIEKCIELIKNRINELNKYQKASVYTNYKENKFSPHDGTIIIFEEAGIKTANFLGNWMTDMMVDINNIKGYPFDGKWCDVEEELLKKGNVFVLNDIIIDGFSLMIDATKIVVKGNLICSPRTSFGEGIYLKR